MNSGTCKTCKWWSDSLSITNNKSDCGLVDSIQPKDISFEIEADADDDSGLMARLITSGNFGCVLHEPKKDNS